MSKLSGLIIKAEHSSLSRWLLNLAVSYAVPFNRPHRIRIVEIKPGETKVLLPYRRKNMNHVKGIHACALATLCEFTTGMTLLSMISESEYRIILKNIRMEYHYQAKMDVFGKFALSTEFLKTEILLPLKSSDAIFTELEINVNDVSGNHICTGYINWQVKKWSKVMSKHK